MNKNFGWLIFVAALFIVPMILRGGPSAYGSPSIDVVVGIGISVIGGMIVLTLFRLVMAARFIPKENKQPATRTQARKEKDAPWDYVDTAPALAAKKRQRRIDMTVIEFMHANRTRRAEREERWRKEQEFLNDVEKRVIK